MKVKKILAAFILSCSISYFAQNVCATSIDSYNDVNSKDWYYEAVDYVSSEGLFLGTSEDNFSPNLNMTRAMFVTVLGRYDFGKEIVWNGYDKLSFEDVSEETYYSKFVEWSYQKNIVKGIGSQLFDPNAGIKREEIVTILYRYAQQSNFDTLFSQIQYCNFNDTEKVSNYAIDAFKWCTDKGIIKGIDNTLAPQEPATRAQCAQIMYRFSKLFPRATMNNERLFKLDANAVDHVILRSGNNGNICTVNDSKQVSDMVKYLNGFCYDEKELKTPSSGWSYIIEIHSVMDDIPISLQINSPDSIIIGNFKFHSSDENYFVNLISLLEEKLK